MWTEQITVNMNDQGRRPLCNSGDEEEEQYYSVLLVPPWMGEKWLWLAPSPRPDSKLDDDDTCFTHDFLSASKYECDIWS